MIRSCQNCTSSLVCKHKEKCHDAVNMMINYVKGSDLAHKQYWEEAGLLMAMYCKYWATSAYEAPNVIEKDVWDEAKDKKMNEACTGMLKEANGPIERR